MNTSNHSKNLFALPVLIASLGLILAAPVMAQTFRTLHTFTELSVVVSNSDGAGPWGELILSGSTLYGTTEIGGSSGNGTVFAINTDGTGFTNLHSFTPLFGIHLVNCDGASPRAGLVLSGNTLYGTTGSGGSSGNARCLPSKPMGRVLRTCIISWNSVRLVPIATELILMPV